MTLILVLAASVSACNMHPISRSLTRYGYMDTAGRVVIPTQFKDAQHFSEGLAAVEVDGRWGYIDRNGQMVIQPQFHKGKAFKNGRARVEVSPDSWRYIDRREPLTMDEYLSARMISSPLCLYDCDRYTDASTVLIVSAADAIDEVECKPIRIAAMAGSVERHSWDQAEWMACYATGADLWKQTDYRPADVDTAQLYDGFSFQAVAWLEALGFCDIGEGGRFIEGGKRIALDGELPLNTFGGQIGAGRLHGFGFAHEGVVQARARRGTPDRGRSADCRVRLGRRASRHRTASCKGLRRWSLPLSPRPLEQLPVREHEEYRRLYEKHQSFEERLEKLNTRLFLSDEEKVEAMSLKKQKLALKDRRLR